MKQFIFTTILTLFFSFSVFAQNEKSICPTIEITGGGVVQPSELMIFTAKVQNQSNDLKIEYEWTVSNGTIVKGQNSSSISVDTTGLNLQEITATVEVNGTGKKVTARDKQIRKIITFRQYDSSRIQIISGGSNPMGKEILTKIYVLPAGMEFLSQR